MPEEFEDEQVVIDPEEDVKDIVEPVVIEDPEVRFPTSTTEDNVKDEPDPLLEEDDELDPVVAKRVSKMIEEATSKVRKEFAPASTANQEIRDRIDVDDFVRNNPAYGKYRESMLKHLSHPAYKNIPVSSIAAIVSAKDQQAIGARKEREAQLGVAATKTAGSTVRPTGGAKDWLTATDEEYQAKKLEVLGMEG